MGCPKSLLLLKKTFSSLRQHGVRVTLKKIKQKLRNPNNLTSFVQKQIKIFSQKEIEEIKRHITSLKLQPLISILMPVYNTNPKYLKKALDSVCNQIYPNWELCIADDHSTKKTTIKLLEAYGSRDSRIKSAYRKTNGRIPQASNTALNLCTGEFVALMDHDDILPIHALYMVILEINKTNNKVDLIYSDEDKINKKDQRSDSYFKSDWNDALVLGQNFVAHLGVYRTQIVKEIGGFRDGYEGSQDYDMFLRYIEKIDTNRIRHIPHILYHWRNFQGNRTFSSNNHHVSDRSAYRALNGHLSRTLKEGFELLPMTSFPGSWRVKFALPAHKPLVTLIIPTRDRVDLLKVCINGLLYNTDYKNIEIIIVNNDSQERETLAYFDELERSKTARILHESGPFNYSRLNNLAARAANGSILGFLNNDIGVIEPGWLEEMVSQLLRGKVGAVGARLLYENNTVQHAGIVLGIYATACHPHRHLDRHSAGYFVQV